MGSWRYRAVSLVMIVAFAGTPAFAAACAALCMPAVAHGSSVATADTGDHHAGHGSMPASPATANERKPQASGDHHSFTQEREPSVGTSREGVINVAAASDRSCCTSGDAALTAFVAVRADTGALLSTAAVFTTPFHSPVTLRNEPKYSPPARESPTRTPLVLRV